MSHIETPRGTTRICRTAANRYYVAFDGDGFISSIIRTTLSGRNITTLRRGTEAYTTGVRAINRALGNGTARS